jgi:UDP-N-acetylglucosamine enolpyruvyl transferase
VAEETIIANQAIEPEKQLLAMTLNNLGWYYKHMGNTSLSLFYLKNAIINSGDTIDDRVNVAGAYLNIWAIFAQKEKHESAVKSA